MYRRSKFLELLLEIRCEMAEEAGHDLDQFVQNLHGGRSITAKSSAAPVRHADHRVNGTELKKAVAAKRR